MGKNKLRKFSENLLFRNVYENFDIQTTELLGEGGTQADLKGKWATGHFHNDHPITLELACGRGEYSLALARRFPDRNFIGVDIKGARIWKGASQALEEDLANVAFLRTRIEKIASFFEAGEIDEIWITFPDPFPRKSKANRRLSGPNFIKEYRKILRQNGTVHLKTDDPGLYEFTMASLSSDPECRILYHSEDIYVAPLVFPELEIKTYYERMHLEAEKKIKYIRFSIHPDQP